VSFNNPAREPAASSGRNRREFGLNQDALNRRPSTMNTILLTSQIVCCGVSIVSASLNIARFVRRRRSKSLRTFRSFADLSPRRLASPQSADFS
jgi:hypothetical protein